MTSHDPGAPGRFIFAIRDTDESGVEILKLTRFLTDLSSAFFVIARTKKGLAGTRPGRRATAEEALAKFKLVSISPGSTIIELAPPTSQDQLPMLTDEATPEDVMIDFYREVERIQEGTPPPPDRTEIRRGVRSVLEDAAEIGSRAEISFVTRMERPGINAHQEFRKTFNIRDLPEAPAQTHSTRERRVSGHAYMVDVEPGRERLRIKLPDGRDMTVDVEETLLDAIRSALDQPVDIELEEESDGSTTIRRTVRELNVLPSSGIGSDQPPKTLEELAQEQGLAKELPDYVALVTAIWPRMEDVDEFIEEIRELRRAETPG